MYGIMEIFNRDVSDFSEKIRLQADAGMEKIRNALSYGYHCIGNTLRHRKAFKVLAVLDRSCNLGYLSEVLAVLKASGHIVYRTVGLEEFLRTDESVYDLILYQTWTSDIAYAPLADQKFIESRPKKILFDAHASGSYDTYFRFSEFHLPRIKNAPHRDYEKKYRVIAATTHPVRPLRARTVPREVDISYCVGQHTHELRPKIYERLLPYQKHYRVDFSNNKHLYAAYLRRVRISINAPGYGEGTFRHLYTLNAGALLFAHDSIEPIRLLPHAALVPGEDYISFHLNNFEEKLEEALSKPKMAREIGENGFRKFMIGYDIRKSAEEIMTRFSEIIGEPEEEKRFYRVTSSFSGEKSVTLIRSGSDRVDSIKIRTP